MKRVPRILAVLLPLALAACGFHLRGALALPSGLEEVRVSTRDPYSPLAQSLGRALEHAGAKVVPADERRRVATLNIRSERWASRPLSIDQFGRAQEYTLLYAVVFSLTDADGDEVVPQQAVEMSRDYVSSPTEITGADTERELLVREMQREMVSAILRRIDAASREPRAAR
jgi:LPS-assembly lipoprotein